MQPPSQLVNFSLHPLVELTSTSVSADRYHVNNLVSTDASTRTRGFRVEHFMRPPVQLDFEFRLPLNVAYIVIQPDLAPTSEMRLEVAGSFHNAKTSTNLAKICPTAVVKGNQTALILENKSFTNQQGRRDLVSKKTDIVSLEVQCSFVNGGGGSCLAGVQLTKLPLKNPNILLKLIQLRVTVNWLSGPKPVALKTVEVWGAPSNNCTQFQLNLLQSSLSGVLGRSCASEAGGVRLYEKAGLQQMPVTYQQPSINAHELHSARVDTELRRSSGTCYSKTRCSLREKESALMGSTKQGKVQRSRKYDGAGSSQWDIQEVSHIKEQTSENKKSLKPQQSGSAGHLGGCSSDIVKKPSPTGLNKPLPQGKNGSLSPSDDEFTHNSSRVNDEENSLRSSCGFGTATAPSSQQQQERQTQCTFIEEEIPPEFLDRITYEIMHVPMVLPSGYCVDRSTLEKLSNSDALYGRPPSDPFTGIPFSRICKPEFSTKLKLQLDNFLSSSSVAPSLSTAAAPRTVGTAEQISAHFHRVEEREGIRKRTKDEPVDDHHSQEPSGKKLRLMTMEDASYAVHHSQRAAPPWAGPSTHSSSYQRDRDESTKQDQRPEHRILNQDAQSSSQGAEDNQQNQFEKKVAGSLDQALRKLLSDS